MDLFRNIDRFLSRHLTPAVRLIFVVCVAAFLAAAVLSSAAPGVHDLLKSTLGLVPRLAAARGFLWQFVTHLFLHLGGLHLLFNMLVLWFAGPELERRWGSARFWRFYLTTGIGAGAAAAAILVAAGRGAEPLFGASAAIYGILLAYAAYFPDRQVLLWGVFPIMIKYLVALAILLELIFARGGPAGSGSGIANIAGLAIAFAYLARFHRTIDITRWRYLR